MRAGVATPARTAIASALVQIALRYRVYQTVRALSVLDDSTLRDIGLDRCQIMWAASRAAKVAAHRKRR